MMQTTRREFLKRSGASVAGLSLLPSKLIASSPGSSAASNDLPPHKSMVVPGIHGYAEQSVAAGETIHFRISSTVPHQLGIYRLGLDPESPSQDELLHKFAESPALPQSIHPGSYVRVDKNLKGPVKTLTLECWVRRWKVKDFAGIITQYDQTGAKEFGLFVGPGGALSFCIGDKVKIDDASQQISSKAGLSGERWRHVVAAWDGRHRIVFIDGEQIAKWPCKTQLSAGKAPLRLAAAGENGEASGFLDGDLAMPVIYRHALSKEEVVARYEEKALMPAKGRDVAACWKFYEDQGVRVADSSGNSRHGRIVNHATWMIPGPSFDFEVIRFASYEPRKDRLRGHAVRFASDDLYDCRWKQTHEFAVPASARSGFYVGRVEYEWEGKPHLYHITFIVRKRARRRKAPILLLAATNTWRAYSSAAFSKPQALLKRNVGTGGTENSPGDPPAFSFYRRHAAGQGGFQIGLRMPFVGADPYLLYGAEYSHLMRADRFMQVWLEKSGYDYDVISDLDLHRDPEILLGYRTFIMNGHSEYWSLPAYHGLEKYLQRGGNVIVLSGNTMLWRVSFNDDASIIECRKVDAPGEQMLPHERGECWHSHDGKRGGFFRECGPPSYRLIGLDMLGFANEDGFGPYVVEQADHFLFHQPEETGLKAGDQFGQGADGNMPRASGHEVDIRMSTFAALQEQPMPAGASVPSDPPGMTRIANAITNWEKGTAFDYFFRVIKPKTPQGAEMIFWERPDGGKVFNAGAIASGWAIHADSKFQTLMRNILAHFGVARS
jgi:hypothetical protein